MELLYEGENYIIEEDNFIAKNKNGEIIILPPRNSVCFSCVHKKILGNKAIKCMRHKLPFKATGKCNGYEEV